MGSTDLFRQLTRGARFSRPKPKATLSATITTENSNECNKDDDKKLSDVKEEAGAFPPGQDELADNFEFISPALAKELDTKEQKRSALKSSRGKPPPNAEKLAQQQKDREIEALRREHRITVFGKHISAPLNCFEDLCTTYGMCDRLLANVGMCGYQEPTPIQRQALPILMEQRSLLACAPTGSGKTLAFLLPILHNLGGPVMDGCRALVVAPTRELAQQIYRECVRLSEKTGLKVQLVGMVKETQQRLSGNAGRHCDILISTPKRVVTLLEQRPHVLDLSSVKWLVMDEADRLLEPGEDQFKEQLDKILAASSHPKRRLALFSATSTVPVTKWALRYLKDLVRVHIGLYNAANETVQQELMFVGSESGKLLAVRELVRTGLKPPVLIFLQSKERAKQLYDELLYDGINVDVIHADRSQQQRENGVKAFREGKIWILICTELMARGIDFKGVNLVINYDFPPSTIAYVHRIGRTGRAGRPGRAITFFTQNDSTHLRSIAEIIRNSGGKVPEFMLKLKAPTKSEKRKLARSAPEREDISTKLPKFVRGKTKKSDNKSVENKTKIRSKRAKNAS